jgi:hypothetical protein
MVRTFLKVSMELGSYFVSARTNKRHQHLISKLIERCQSSIERCRSSTQCRREFDILLLDVRVSGAESALQ